MTAQPYICPHCGSPNHRMLADRLGAIAWCRDCHHTWEPAQARPPASAGQYPNLPSKRDRRFG